MAINLGDVNFRLGADTRNLSKAVRDLKAFGTQVDAAAQRTGKAAQSTAKALRQQEKAASDALRAVANMNSKFRNYDFGTKLVRQANAAFRQYNQTLTSGKLSAVDFQRAQAQFKNSIAATNREFTRLRKQAAPAGQEVKRLEAFMRELSATSVLISGPLGGVTARLNTLTALSRSSGLAIAGLVASIAAGAAGFLMFGRSMVTAGRQMERYNQMLVSVTGDQELANVRMDRAIQIARNTGQTLESVIPSYAKFLAAAKGTSLEGEHAEEIFTAIGLAMSKMQAPAEQTQGVFKALEQMMSKGLVQAEELRGQLGDRLPGAFQIAARAMGVTTAELVKMTKQGELLTEDFLPKFAAEVRRTFDLVGTDSVDNFTASWNNLQNAWTLLMATFDDVTGASAKVKSAIDSTTSTLDMLRQNIDVVVGAMGALLGASLALAGPAILAGLGKMLAIIRSLATATTALNVAMLANPAGKLVGLFLRLASAIAGATAGYATFKSLVGDTTELLDRSTESIDDFIRTQKLMRTSSKEITQEYISDVKERIAKLKEERAELEKQIKAPKSTDFLSEIMSSAGGLSETEQQFITLGKQIRHAEDQLKELANVLQVIADEDEFSLNLTDNFKESRESVDEMIESVIELQRQIHASQTGGMEALIRAEDLAEARKEIAALNSDELTALSNHLASAGFAGETVVAQFADLIGRQRELTDEIEAFKESVNSTDAQEALLRQAEAMQAFNMQLEIMDQQIDAFNQGADAVNKLNEQLERRETIEAYAKSLEEAGFSFDVVNEKVDVFKQKLTELNQAKSSAKEVEATLSELENAGARSMENLGDIVSRDIAEMKLGFQTLADVVSSVANDIIQTLFKLAVTNPLKNALFGTDSATLQGGGLLGSFFGNLFGFGSASAGAGSLSGSVPMAMARNGAAFGTLKAANGILSKPTIMSSTEGPVLGGEAGQEAIMPLERDSAGQLGVKANISGGQSSGAGNVFINIIGGGDDVKTEERREGGNLNVDIIFKQIENRMSEQVSKGGTKINRAMESRYGLNAAAGNQR